MIAIERMGRLALGGAFFAALVACSGAIATPTGDGTSSGSSGASSSSGSSGASSSSGGSSSGDTACSVQQVDVTRACVPGTAVAGAPIVVQAESDFSNCLSCGVSLEPCSVVVTGQTISIRLDSRSCTLPPGTGCPSICGLPVAQCTIPPLAAGTYTLDLAGGVRTSADVPRQLVVKDAGGTSTCSLSTDTPLPLDPANYPDACTVDEDCALVTGGNQCQLCTCPNEAIAKTGLESFESTQRALRSQCKMDRSGPICAGCAPHKARCTDNKCVAVSG